MQRRRQCQCAVGRSGARARWGRPRPRAWRRRAVVRPRRGAAVRIRGGRQGRRPARFPVVGEWPRLRRRRLRTHRDGWRRGRHPLPRRTCPRLRASGGRHTRRRNGAGASVSKAVSVLGDGALGADHRPPQLHGWRGGAEGRGGVTWSRVQRGPVRGNAGCGGQGRCFKGDRPPGLSQGHLSRALKGRSRGT